MTRAIAAGIRGRVRVRRVHGVVDDPASVARAYDEVHPAAPIVRREPRAVGPGAAGLLDHVRRIEGPSAFRLTLSGARVVGHDPLVLTDDYRALAQSAFDHEQLMKNAVMHERLPLAQPIDRAAVLVGPWHTSYFHWITDHLPRLALLGPLDKLGMPVLTHGYLTPAQIDSLGVAGLTPDRLIPYSHPHVRIGEALWPSLPGRTGNTPRWAAEWLRERLAPPAANPARLLYASRADTPLRRVVNDAEVATALASLGVETVRPDQLGFREQMELFAQARLVVGAHGAGLTNMIAARGATIIEVFDPRYVNGCFYALAEALGHDYWHMSATPMDGGGISIDTDLLVQTVELALKGPAQPS